MSGMGTVYEGQQLRLCAVGLLLVVSLLFASCSSVGPTTTVGGADGALVMGAGGATGMGGLDGGSDPPPGAVVTKDVTLPDSPLTRMQNVSLMRAGDSFILAGFEGGRVRWGRLALDGTLTEEAGFALAQPVLGPVFGATMKTTAGDQLVAIVVTNSATTPGAYDLSAIVQTMGASTTAAPVVLVTLAIGTDPSLVQIAAGVATSGRVGFVAWGTRVPGISPAYLLLPADAVTVAAPSKLFDGFPADIPNWDCLATTNGTTGLGFSVVTPDTPGTSDLVTSEVSETGGLAVMTYQFIVVVANCRVVSSPGPAGSYVMAMQTRNAIDFAMYYSPLDPTVPVGGTMTTNDPVLATGSLGDPLTMPHLAWVSPAGGGDISIGLARAAGPQILRYTYDTIPHGSPLTLRSEKGQTGPVASWVGPDAVYVTYADQANTTPPSVKRYFMRLESPVLP
jgi:hypothetical protein